MEIGKFPKFVLSLERYETTNSEKTGTVTEVVNKKLSNVQVSMSFEPMRHVSLRDQSIDMPRFSYK